MSNTKKIYNLSKYTQGADKQKEIKTNSGKIYNISFRPAMVDRKYYKRWTELQTEIITRVNAVQAIQAKVKIELKISDEDSETIKEFKELATEATEVGEELIIYTIRANGYDNFDEDELLGNFSEADMAYSINIIMNIDIDAMEKVKKNSVNKKTNSKTGK